MTTKAKRYEAEKERLRDALEAGVSVEVLEDALWAALGKVERSMLDTGVAVVNTREVFQRAADALGAPAAGETVELTEPGGAR